MAQLCQRGSENCGQSRSDSSVCVRASSRGAGVTAWGLQAVGESVNQQNERGWKMRSEQRRQATS